MLVDQQGRLAHLVDHAAGRALAEQHRGRALEHFHAVVVERIALQQRGVFHAVVVNVACLAQRETAQTHVFLTRFACQEGHAGGGAQHFAEVVLVAVVHQLFSEHRDRLRNVLDLLLALAHGGLLDQQGVFALWGGLLLHRHGGQRGFGCGAGLRPAANRGGQHHGAQGQQDFVGLGGGRGSRLQHAAAARCAGFCQGGLRKWVVQVVWHRSSARTGGGRAAWARDVPRADQRQWLDSRSGACCAWLCVCQLLCIVSNEGHSHLYWCL